MGIVKNKNDFNLYNEGEEYILYLHHDLYDELFVVGGPQGRFLVENSDGEEAEVTNQIDRVVEKEAKEKYKVEKKFAKKENDFKKATKDKVEKIKKVKEKNNVK